MADPLFRNKGQKLAGGETGTDSTVGSKWRCKKAKETYGVQYRMQEETLLFICIHNLSNMGISTLLYSKYFRILNSFTEFWKIGKHSYFFEKVRCSFFKVAVA